MECIEKKIPTWYSVSLLVGLLFALGSCAPAKMLQNANKSKNTLATDVAGCHSRASSLMGRELTLERSYERSEGGSLELSFANFDAQKQKRLYFENCMAQPRRSPISPKRDN